ncbi:MAG: U32 family peptidase [Bacilli bacterium]|nr:U32 family peptidase [Bacilli bacterium]
MKLMVSPSKIEDFDHLIDLNINSFLLGFKHLSLYHNFYIDINELKSIVAKYPHIELYISLNKLMHNYDLELLRRTLNDLSKLKINGVLYDDVAVLNIVKHLKLDINLIWAATHQVTNYHTINTLKNNIDGALISSEISLDEILEIRNNTKLDLIVPIFGYQIMTTSKRTLITNYQNHLKINIRDDLYYLKDEDHIYPVIEDENGTHILTADILNGIDEVNLLEEQKINYLYLSSLNLESTLFNQVVAFYQDRLNDKKIDIANLNSLIPNNDSMFLYKESYFKVNAND